MENNLRARLIEWLASDPALAGINTFEEESPLSSSPPWLGIAASGSVDWGCKDRRGSEVRLALELESRSDRPEADAELLRSIKSRVLNLPVFHSEFEVASVRFLRSRSEARADNRRGALLEFRFRIFEPLN